MAVFDFRYDRSSCPAEEIPKLNMICELASRTFRELLLSVLTNTDTKDKRKTPGENCKEWMHVLPQYHFLISGKIFRFGKETYVSTEIHDQKCSLVASFNQSYKDPLDLLKKNIQNDMLKQLADQWKENGFEGIKN